MVHTILLIQFAADGDKLFEDFDSISDMCRALCRMFEELLKAKNTNKREISYDLSSLYEWLDGVTIHTFLNN